MTFGSKGKQGNRSLKYTKGSISQETIYSWIRFPSQLSIELVVAASLV